MRKTVQIETIIKKEFPELALNPHQFDQIERYLSLLQQWNKKINLTAVRQYDEMVYKHILDSMALFLKGCSFINHSANIIDIGTGAGLPGLILNLIYPTLKITSIDKVEKKIIFQQVCKSKLELKDFNPITGRIEDLLNQKSHKNNYHYMISRAFTQIQFLLIYGAQLLRQSGKLILWKGENWMDEYRKVPDDVKNLFEAPQVFKYQFKKIGGTLLSFEIKH